MPARRRERSLKRGIIKAITGLIVAYVVSRLRANDDGKGVKKSEPWPQYIFVLGKACCALIAVVITALVFDRVASRRESSEEKKKDQEPHFSFGDEGLPSEDSLREHLRNCKLNLAKATELRQEQGDLSQEQNKLLDAKFAEMSATITMTQELLQHIIASKSSTFQSRRAQRRAQGAHSRLDLDHEQKGVHGSERRLETGQY